MSEVGGGPHGSPILLLTAFVSAYGRHDGLRSCNQLQGPPCTRLASPAYRVACNQLHSLPPPRFDCAWHAPDNRAINYTDGNAPIGYPPYCPVACNQLHIFAARKE